MSPRNQLKLFIALVIALLLLSFLSCGCSNHTPPKRVTPAYTAPTVSKVVEPVKSSQVITKKLIQVIEVQTIDETKKDLEQISKNLEDAEKYSNQLQAEIDKSTEILNQAVIDRDKAIDAYNYAESKRQKALVEIWKWRIGALAVLGIIGGLIAAKLGFLGAKLMF